MGSFVAQYIAVFNIMRSCCIKLSPNTFLTKKKSLKFIGLREGGMTSIL